MQITLQTIIRDAATDTDHWKISVVDIRGNVRVFTVPREWISPRRQSRILEQLESVSAALGHQKIKRILKTLLKQEPLTPLTIKVRQMGIYRDGFISPAFTIGAFTGQVEFITDQDTRNMRCQGTLDGWAEIFKIAKYSSTMTLSAILPFAARTLGEMETKSFGICLFGMRKTGKSANTTVAASAIGYGSEADLPNFNRTEASLQELLGTFRNHLLPINEAEHLSRDTKAKGQALEKLAYALSEGRGKSMSSTVKRPAQPISTIVLGNFEERHVREASGADVRMLLIPAKRRKDPDCFDRAPPGLGDKRIDWARKRFRRQRKICRDHHGVAFRTFCEYVHDNDKWVDTLRTAHREFEDRYSGRIPADHSALYVLSFFSHVYGSAVVARDAGVVRLSKSHIRRSLWTCFKRWQRSSVEMSGANKFLQAIKNGHFADRSDTERLAGAAGYIEKTDGRRVIVVRTPDFIKLIGSQNAAFELLERLHAANLIGSRPQPRRSSAKDFEQHLTWPNNQRVRSLRIIFNKRAIQKVIDCRE